MKRQTVYDDAEQNVYTYATVAFTVNKYHNEASDT